METTSNSSIFAYSPITMLIRKLASAAIRAFLWFLAQSVAETTARAQDPISPHRLSTSDFEWARFGRDKEKLEVGARVRDNIPRRIPRDLHIFFSTATSLSCIRVKMRRTYQVRKTKNDDDSQFYDDTIRVRISLRSHPPPSTKNRPVLPACTNTRAPRCEREHV